MLSMAEFIANLTSQRRTPLNQTANSTFTQAFTDIRTIILIEKSKNTRNDDDDNDNSLMVPIWMTDTLLLISC